METALFNYAITHHWQIKRALAESSITQIQYRYPALTQTELEIEAYFRYLERESDMLEIRTRDFMPCSAPRKMAKHAPEVGMCDAVCEQQAPAIVEYRNEVEYEIHDERELMMREIRERIDKLRELGVDELVLRKLLEREDTLSRLIVTPDYRILLPDYHDMEIEMTPLPKAVYLLFLRHEEGIAFKFLSDYEAELKDIYLRLTDRVQNDVIDKSIQAICDPTQNAINEKCARIREAFVTKFDERLAQHYFVTGRRGEPKRIALQRSLVTWN